MKKQFLLTDKMMTRFNILLADGIKFVDYVLKSSIGGEIFVPKMKSYKVIDLAKAHVLKIILKLLE